MSYLAIDLAIWERLTGAPLDKNGNPVVDDNGIPVNRHLPGLINTEPNEVEASNGVVGPPPRPSYGVRIPVLNHHIHKTRMPYKVPNTNHNAVSPPRLATDFAKHNYVAVPVYPQNIEGLDLSSVWPAVTFNWLDSFPDTVSTTYGDYGMVPAPNAAIITKDGVTGADRRIYLPTPEAFVATVMIRVYAKNSTDLKLICDCIHRLFPNHTALLVELADGSKRSFSMSLLGVENLDFGGRENSRTLSNERELSRGFIYEISGFVDNSLASTSDGGLGQQPAEQHGIILERWLELQKKTVDYVQRLTILGTE